MMRRKDGMFSRRAGEDLLRRRQHKPRGGAASSAVHVVTQVPQFATPAGASCGRLVAGTVVRTRGAQLTRADTARRSREAGR